MASFQSPFPGSSSDPTQMNSSFDPPNGFVVSVDSLNVPVAMS